MVLAPTTEMMPILQVEVVLPINTFLSILNTKPSHIHAWWLDMVCLPANVRNFITGTLKFGANYFYSNFVMIYILAT